MKELKYFQRATKHVDGRVAVSYRLRDEYAKTSKGNTSRFMATIWTDGRLIVNQPTEPKNIALQPEMSAELFHLQEDWLEANHQEQHRCLT